MFILGHQTKQGPVFISKTSYYIRLVKWRVTTNNLVNGRMKEMEKKTKKKKWKKKPDYFHTQSQNTDDKYWLGDKI